MVWSLEATPEIIIFALAVARGEELRIGTAIKDGLLFSDCSWFAFDPDKNRLRLIINGSPNLNTKSRTRIIPNILKSRFFLVFCSILLDNLDLAIIL